MYTKAYGLAPSHTTLTVVYTTGGGVKSNVPAFTIKNIGQVNIQVDEISLDNVLLDKIKASLAVYNPTAAAGGKSQETLDEIKQNAAAYFASQQRTVTAQDYIIRAYSLPPKFGSVAKAYVIPDSLIEQTANAQAHNPFAINLYTLGYDNNKNLTQLNNATISNLKTYINQYRILTDAINIKNAFVINIGLSFEVIILPGANAQEVLLKCITKLKELFDIDKWQINQPIILSKLYTELDRIDGVQSVPKITINNLYNGNYSPVIYNIPNATRSGVIYPSLDPSIFEIKYPDTDIVGKVVSI